MVSSVFGAFWWRVGRLQRCCVTMFEFVAFTIVPEHGGRFVSSGLSLQRMHRPCAFVVFALYSKLCQRGVLVAQRFSWFPSLPPLSCFRVSPFVSGVCSFYFHWAFWPYVSVTGAIVGGLGAGGLVAGLRVPGWQACGCSSALGCDCCCSPLAHGHPTSTCDAGIKESNKGSEERHGPTQSVRCNEGPSFRCVH